MEQLPFNSRCPQGLFRSQLSEYPRIICSTQKADTGAEAAAHCPKPPTPPFISGLFSLGLGLAQSRAAPAGSQPRGRLCRHQAQKELQPRGKPRHGQRDGAARAAPGRGHACTSVCTRCACLYMYAHTLCMPVQVCIQSLHAHTGMYTCCACPYRCVHTLCMLTQV